MSRWLPRVLERIRELAMARDVSFTLKALRELAILELGLDVEDACDLLANLSAEDSIGRMESLVTGEWLYLFKISVTGVVLYLKVVLRDDCVVVSFHEDDGDDDETR